MTSNAHYTVRWLTPILLAGVLFGCASDTTTALGLSIQATPSNLVGVQNQPLGGGSNVVFQVEGGTPGATYFWNLSGTLPPGVTASPADGATPSGTLTLSGTPSTVGVYSFTLAIDAVPNHEQLLVASFSIQIQGSSGGPLQILTKTLYWPSALSDYLQTLSASGGTPPYTWSATFPSNLSLSTAGGVSGDTTTPGTFDVLVTLRDSVGQVIQDTVRLRVLTAADFQGTWSGVITKGGFISPITFQVESLVGQRLGLVFDNAGVITQGALHATALRRNQENSADVQFGFGAPYLGQFNGRLPQLTWHAACKPIGDQELRLDCVMHYLDPNNDATLTLSRISANSQDTTAPTVTSNPPSGATDVTARQMTLTFSEPMSSGSATSLSAGGTVDAVTFSPDGTSATLSFGGLLDFQNYTLTLNPVGQVGFLDLAGNALAQQVITFRTGALSNNQLPVAQAQSVIAVHGQPRGITLEGTDPDNNTPLTYAITAQPANGSLSSVSGASVVYTSNMTYTGSDSFMFTVTDSLNGVSQPAQVTLNVTNQSPTAGPQSNVSVVHDGSVGITLVASDADGDGLTYTVSDPPNGTAVLTGTGPAVTYTPNVGYVGTDSFTYSVRDTAGVTSNIATVNITVTNETPIATAQSVSTLTTTPLNIQLAGTDADGDALTYTVTDQPNNGTLSGTAPNVIYTWNGVPPVSPDSLQFTVTDTAGAVSAAATVSIDVRNTNQPPTAGPQPNVSAVHDRSTGITLVASDPDNDPLTFTISDPPSGTVTGSGPAVTYTPNAGYLGADSFTFSVRDPAGLTSTTATVNITVTNQPPTAGPQPNVTVVHDGSVAITLVRNDPDGDALTYTISDPPNGTITGPGPAVTYTPNAGYVGNDSFTFSVQDNVFATSNTATVNISVTNQPPTANNQPVSVTVNTPRIITLTGSDPDVDPLTFAIATGPSNGSLSAVTGASVTYTPNAAYIGPDSFTFTVRDTADTVSAPATVSLTVTGVDSIPTADNQTYPSATGQIGRRDWNDPLQFERYAITLTGSDLEGPVTFRLTEFAPYPAIDPAPLPGSVRDPTLPMDMVLGTSYWFRNEATNTLEFRAATTSTTVDPTTGQITVSPAGSPATIIYTPVSCHFREALEDRMRFVVTDSINQTSAEATVTIRHQASGCAHPPGG